MLVIRPRLSRLKVMLLPLECTIPPALDRHRVAVRIGNALQTCALVDDISRAVFGRELEHERVEDVHAAAKADQVHRPGYAAINLERRSTPRLPECPGCPAWA